MPQPQTRQLVLALLTALSLCGVANADPQAPRSIEERRAQEQRGNQPPIDPRNMDNREKAPEQAEQAEVAPRYPQADRVEPEGKATSKHVPKLQQQFDAFNAKATATVLMLADELIADPETNPYEKSVSARLAGASQLNVDNAKAMAYLQKAIEFNGLNNNEHFEAMFLIAQLQMQEKQYAQSLATVDQFLTQTKSQTPDALALKGNALYRLKRYPEAVEALKQALAGAPQPRADWTQLLMGAYAEMGKPEEASKLAEQLGAGNPDDKQGQLNLAATYMQSGQDDKAAAILEKLRSSGQLTEEQDYRNLFAMYSNAGGKDKEVITVINEGMSKGILKPDHQVYTALAQAYWFSDQVGPAIEAFKKAAPIAPNGEAYLNLARALSNEGRTAEAREAAKQALAKGVKKPEDANRIIGTK
jgi:tetratricopeptide (TPR) repeat protein